MHHTINSRRPIECHFIDDIHITLSRRESKLHLQKLGQLPVAIGTRHKRVRRSAQSIIFTFSDLKNTKLLNHL